MDWTMFFTCIFIFVMMGVDGTIAILLAIFIAAIMTITQPVIETVAPPPQQQQQQITYDGDTNDN